MSYLDNLVSLEEPLFAKSKMHPIVVKWMQLAADLNIKLLEEEIIRSALRGEYTPVQGKTAEKSSRDPHLAIKIRSALGDRVPAEWQFMEGEFRCAFEADMPPEYSDEIRRLSETDRHLLCGLTVMGNGASGGLHLKLTRPVLAMPVRRRARFGGYLHAYRLSPVLAEMVSPLMRLASHLTCRYPKYYLAVREEDNTPDAHIKPGKRFKTAYLEGCMAAFCLAYRTTF